MGIRKNRGLAIVIIIIAIGMCLLIPRQRTTYEIDFKLITSTPEPTATEGYSCIEDMKPDIRGFLAGTIPQDELISKAKKLCDSDTYVSIQWGARTDERSLLRILNH